MRLSPPATDTQRGLRSERGTPRSAPMHYLRTHTGQGMVGRQGRWQTGGRGTPRLGLLRQDSRRGRDLFGKGGRLTRSATVPRLAAELGRPPHVATLKAPSHEAKPNQNL